MPREISVIIVNYNTKELIEHCIKSIIVNTIDIDYEIIIVDNASTDESKIYLTDRFKEIKWIQSAQNLGFGKANNLGVKHAEGKYIFLLNPDTILQNNAILLFRDFLSKQDSGKVGIIGGYLTDKENKLNNYSGDIITHIQPLKDLLKGTFNKICHKKINTNEVESVGYVCGADLFMTKSLFDEIGGFDENFFMYCEEVDLQKRILETGRKNLIIPGPKIIHLEGGGEYKTLGLSTRRFNMWQKSIKIYTSKHFNIFQKIGWKINQAIFGIPVILKQDWSIHDKLKAYIYSIK